MNKEQISELISDLKLILEKLEASQLPSKEPVMVDYLGDKSYHLNGKLHREGGPAVENLNGYKAYFIYGERHNESGPAVEFPDGKKEYYINGKLHRLDGPAIDGDGYKAYFINGKRYSKEDYLKHPDVIAALMQKFADQI